jgi:ketosteroid isomerase-like protein
MKQTFTLGVLLVFVLASAFINPLKSQDLKKEMDDLVKKFEAGYNKKDDKALKMLYTDNAVRTDADGTVTTGNENLRLLYIQSWATTNLKLTIKQEKAEKQADGTVIASGTYHATGTINAGEPIVVDGAYVNTVVKEDGKWKIAKSVLSNL